MSLKIAPGTVHALLGENGAGKSTIVKCLLGYYRADEGSFIVDGKEVAIEAPADADRLGLGMVYQHFTLVPSMTAAENLVMARADVPSVIAWRRERERLAAFLATMPFKVPIDVAVGTLAAGERQKLEILKQLYLDRRLIVLDEPTSTLTPAEAEEVLGVVRGMVDEGRLTTIIITHKLKEVDAFADEVSVLRRGRMVGGGRVADLDHAAMTKLMIGESHEPAGMPKHGAAEPCRGSSSPVSPPSATSAIRGFPSTAWRCGPARSSASPACPATVRRTSSRCSAASAAGGGRNPHLRQALSRPPRRGAGDQGPRAAGGAAAQCLRAGMSVRDNLNLRRFDRDDAGRPRVLLDGMRMAAFAAEAIAGYGIRAPSELAPIRALSGGNVQRAVLARELDGDVDLLIVANPCFGLDVKAVAEIRARIVEARNGGAAVLLVSEDLDEILELADRVVVMREGRIVYEAEAGAADAHVIGGHMVGHS